jgi:hypothetical protein
MCFLVFRLCVVLPLIIFWLIFLELLTSFPVITNLSFFSLLSYFSILSNLCSMHHVLILTLGISICLDRVSTVWKRISRQSRFSRQFKNQVLTVSTTLKIKISWFLSRSWSRVSISTVWKRTSRQSRFSWQFEKWHLNVSRHLDLDWSQLLRPPTLVNLFYFSLSSYFSLVSYFSLLPHLSILSYVSSVLHVFTCLSYFFYFRSRVYKRECRNGWCQTIPTSQCIERKQFRLV